MTREDLFSMLGEIDSSYLQEADPARKQRRPIRIWKPLAGLAAILVVALGVSAAVRLFQPKGRALATVQQETVAAAATAADEYSAGAAQKSEAGAGSFLRHNGTEYVFSGTVPALPDGFVLAGTLGDSESADFWFPDFSQSGTPVYVHEQEPNVFYVPAAGGYLRYQKEER